MPECRIARMPTQRLFFAISASLLLHLFLLADFRVPKDTGVHAIEPISVTLKKSAPTEAPAAPLTAPSSHTDKAAAETKSPENPRQDASAKARPSDEKPTHEKLADEQPSASPPPQGSSPEVAQAQRGVTALSGMWERAATMNIRMRQIRLFTDAARMNLTTQLTQNIAKEERDRIKGQECTVKMSDKTDTTIVCQDPELSALILKSINWRLLPKSGDFGFSRLDMEIIIAFSVEGIGIGLKPGSAMLMPAEFTHQ